MYPAGVQQRHRGVNNHFLYNNRHNFIKKKAAVAGGPSSVNRVIGRKGSATESKVAKAKPKRVRTKHKAGSTTTTDASAQPDQPSEKEPATPTVLSAEAAASSTAVANAVTVEN